MASATGLGAAVGALVTAGRGRTRLRALTIGAAAFELLILAAAAAPSLPIELLVLALVGPGQRVVPRRGQHHCPAHHAADDAWSGDGAAGGRVPGIDPGRWSDRGLGQPVRRRPGRPGTWAQRLPAGRAARPGGAASGVSQDCLLYTSDAAAE